MRIFKKGNIQYPVSFSTKSPFFNTACTFSHLKHAEAGFKADSNESQQLPELNIFSRCLHVPTTYFTALQVCMKKNAFNVTYWMKILQMSSDITPPPSPLLMSTADSEAETYFFFSPLKYDFGQNDHSKCCFSAVQVFALVDLQSKMKFFWSSFERGLNTVKRIIYLWVKISITPKKCLACNMDVATMDGNLMWRKSGFESPVKWEIEVLCDNGIIFFVVVGFKTSCMKKIIVLSLIATLASYQKILMEVWKYPPYIKELNTSKNSRFWVNKPSADYIQADRYERLFLRLQRGSHSSRLSARARRDSYTSAPHGELQCSAVFN